MLCFRVFVCVRVWRITVHIMWWTHCDFSLHILCILHIYTTSLMDFFFLYVISNILIVFCQIRFCYFFFLVRAVYNPALVETIYNETAHSRMVITSVVCQQTICMHVNRIASISISRKLQRRYSFSLPIIAPAMHMEKKNRIGETLASCICVQVYRRKQSFMGGLPVS